MKDIVRIGMDTAKNVYQLHGVNGVEEVVLRRQMRRREMIDFFERLPPAMVAIEACASSHYWGRLLRSFGHDVRLIPPQYVKAYVKRGKNDAADAEALCEAVSRPSMRFVPIKSEEQQAVCMLMTGLASAHQARSSGRQVHRIGCDDCLASHSTAHNDLARRIQPNPAAAVLTQINSENRYVHDPAPPANALLP